MMSVSHWVIRSVFTALVWFVAGSGASAAYPERLVRIVVPYPAGGGVDVIARGLANQLSQRWGQPVIVENRAGGMTNIGANAVSKSQPDGYTLLLTTDATITTNPHLFRKMPFDPRKDLVPLVHVANLSFIVVVNPKVPATSMSGLVAMAKSDKSPLFFSSSGNGSQAHLMFEALNRVAHTTLTHVPYSGIAPAIQAVLSGDVQMTLAGGTSEPLIQSNLVRPLAISAEKRVSSLPNVPTFQEAGYPEVDPHGWIGLFAPAGLAPDIATKIETDVLTILKDPDFRKAQFENITFSIPVDSSSKAFGEFINKDFDFKQRLIETTQVKF